MKEAEQTEVYVLAASLIKSEPGKSIHSLMQGYRVARSEDEAKGSFISSVMEEKPEFAISQLLCMVVPRAALSVRP
jgi:hypothetical protein